MEVSRQDVLSHSLCIALGIGIGWLLKRWWVPYLEMREDMLEKKLEKIKKAKDRAKEWPKQVANGPARPSSRCIEAASIASPQFAPPYSYENQTVHPTQPSIYMPPPGVFFSEAPPYTGVNGAPPAYAPNNVNGNFATCGAQQAPRPLYPSTVDPSNPSTAYAPSTYAQHSQASAPPMPPSYEASFGGKKND